MEQQLYSIISAHQFLWHSLHTLHRVLQTFSACSRSSRMSWVSSNPIDSRI